MWECPERWATINDVMPACGFNENYTSAELHGLTLDRGIDAGAVETEAPTSLQRVQ